MPIQRSHGKPKPQIPRVDELPPFLPAEQPVPAGPSQRGADGRFRPGNRISREGGRVRSQVQRHLHSLGLDWLAQDPRAAALRKRAIAQLRAEQRWVASTVGAGVLDPLAAAELRTAVTKETVGQLLMEVPKLVGADLAAGIALADKLLSAARGHRLTAIELSARGAAARLQRGNGPRADLSAIDVSGELAELQRLLADGAPTPSEPAAGSTETTDTTNEEGESK